MKLKIHIKSVVFMTLLFAGVFWLIPNFSNAQSFVASPSTIEKGQKALLAWFAPGYATCDITLIPGDSSLKVTHYGWKGRANVLPERTTTYFITCIPSNKGNQEIFSDEARIEVTSAGSPSPSPSPTPTPAPTPSPSLDTTFDGFLTAGCAVGKTSVKVGESVSFASAGSRGVKPYKFSWSGDVTGNTSQITKTFTSIGFKEAKVTITDASGNSDFAICNITVSNSNNSSNGGGTGALNDADNEDLLDDESLSKNEDETAGNRSGLIAGGVSGRSPFLTTLLVLFLIGNLIALIYCIVRTQRDRDQMDREEAPAFGSAVVVGERDETKKEKEKEE